MGIALLTIVGALIVVLSRNLFHSALGLVASFFGVAGVYFIAEAEFVGVSQVLVYVGAISTLITFATC
jgi:NADH-quinone oxidoreductase subunit J